jgi:hypothetical protein
MPPCVKCKFWSPDDEHKISGWCHHHQILADSYESCESHKPVITSKVITPIPITEAVRAAIYFAKYKESTLSEYCWACDKMERELTNQDKDRVSPQLAAAARILAAEVERLRDEQPQRIARSECCGARAVTAGKPGSTQWHVCPHCCEPCDVYYHDSKPTQP